MQREGVEEQSYLYVTPRTLLAIIRLAQSMAKLNFRNEVKQSDVDEALKLMDFSIKSLRNLKAPNNKKRTDRDQNRDDKMSKVINAVREIMNDGQPMNVNEIMKKLLKGAYSLKLKKEELTDVLDYYKKLNIIYVDGDENVIFL